jgi:hypothetical protein
MTQSPGFNSDFARPNQLRGEIAKWDKEHGWHDTDGMPLPSHMLVVGTDTLLVRWYPEREEKREKPLPDVSDLNRAIPQSEWREGPNGGPEPPWKLNYEIRMVDPVGGRLYAFANSTWGTRLCFDRLNEQVFVTRTLRGVGVVPLVKLDKRPMPTRHGMQSRPHLEPIEYREPGGGPLTLTAQPPALQLPPAPGAAATPAAAAPTPAPATAPAATSTLDAMKPVKPIPIEEFINDSLPF